VSEIRSQATPERGDTKNELAGAVLELLNQAAQIGTPGRAITAHVVARGLSADGWSKPRTVNSAAELEALRVGTRGFTPETWEVWWLRRVGREPHWEGSGGMYSRASDLLAEHGPMTVLFTPGDAG